MWSGEKKTHALQTPWYRSTVEFQNSYKTLPAEILRKIVQEMDLEMTIRVIGNSYGNMPVAIRLNMSIQEQNISGNERGIWIGDIKVVNGKLNNTFMNFKLKIDDHDQSRVVDVLQIMEREGRIPELMHTILNTHIPFSHGFSSGDRLLHAFAVPFSFTKHGMTFHLLAKYVSPQYMKTKQVENGYTYFTTGSFNIYLVQMNATIDIQEANDS